MSEKLPIRLTILGREVPLTIQPSDEEKFRIAEKRINDLVALFRSRYQNADTEKLLTMAILQFAIKLVECEKMVQNDELGNELEKMCEELDEFIKINQ